MSALSIADQSEDVTTFSWLKRRAPIAAKLASNPEALAKRMSEPGEDFSNISNETIVASVISPLSTCGEPSKTRVMRYLLPSRLAPLAVSVGLVSSRNNSSTKKSRKSSAVRLDCSAVLWAVKAEVLTSALVTPNIFLNAATTSAVITLS